jgi:radical SAM protein with 4Fe4S-binding SPASM domain
MPEMPVALFEKFAEEVFPHLTSILLVGRGEPMAITEKLWRSFTEACVRHRVFLGMVTNASYMLRKVGRDLLPWVDRITVSVDGFTRGTFAANRGGDDFEKALEQIRQFHALRTGCSVARRPKLCLSWTLKRNNIAEFPAFARFAAEMDADVVYVRHLLVYHEKDRMQSVLECPEAEAYLREGYAWLDEHGVQKDCPPLVGKVVAQESTGPAAEAEAGPALRPDEKCIYFHRTAVVHHDGTIPTCGAPFTEIAGRLGEARSFWEIWNGQKLRTVRGDLGTEREWPQCRTCWYRELKYDAQREARSHARVFDVARESLYSEKAWDYRGNIVDSLREV